MYKVEIQHESDLKFNALAGDARLDIDAKSKGFTPLDALLAGLGSCIGVYIRKYAEGGKPSLKNFTVTVEGELSKEAPFSFKEISVKVGLKNCALDERRKAAILEFIKNCPAHNTLKGNPTVDIKLIC